MDLSNTRITQRPRRRQHLSSSISLSDLSTPTGTKTPSSLSSFVTQTTKATTVPTWTSTAHAVAATPTHVASAVDQTQNSTTGTIAAIAASGIILFVCLVAILIYLWIRKRHLFRLSRFTKPRSLLGTRFRGSRSLSTAASSITLVSPPGSPEVACGGKVHTLGAFSTPINLPKPRPACLTTPLTPQLEIPKHNTRTAIVRMSQGQIKMDTETARFGRSLGVEDDLESPIDGSSPFRLKRGDTLKRGDSRKLKTGSRAVGEARERVRAASPLKEVIAGAEVRIRATSPLREVTLDMDDKLVAALLLRDVSAASDQLAEPPALALAGKIDVPPLAPGKMSARISTVENYHAY